MEDTDQLKAAYANLEAAIAEAGRLQDFDGLITEWVVVAAVQSYDDDGDVRVQVGTLLPVDGGVPYHRVMGLLDYSLTRCRAAVAVDDE